MKQVHLDPLSYTAFPIKLFDNIGNQLAIATGFYYEINGILWLITNWHNLTGYDPHTEKRKKDRSGKNARSPENIAIPRIIQSSRGIEWKWYIVNLYNADKQPLWRVHPVFGNRVDVVALEVAENIEDNQVLPINTHKWDNMKPIVTDNVYVLGFPYGIKGGGSFPLWKRATIASEPGIDIDNLPQYIIDTTTREGMSGSPVIVRRTGVHNLRDGTPINETMFGEIEAFAGIYSGRLYASETEETQLGRVWKPEVIIQIIKGGKSEDIFYPELEF